MTNRALVIVGPDGVVQWSYQADTPGDLPGVNLIFDALAPARAWPTARARQSKIAATSRCTNAARRRRRAGRGRRVAHGVAHQRAAACGANMWVWCQQRVGPADLHVDEAVRRIPLLDRRQPLTGSSWTRSRYWISVPTRIRCRRRDDRSAARRRDRLELRASAKNGKTASGVPGRRCPRSTTWTARDAYGPRSRRPPRRRRCGEDDHVAATARAGLLVDADLACPRCAVAVPPLPTRSTRRVPPPRAAARTRAPSRSPARPRRPRRQGAFWAFARRAATPTRGASTTRTCGRAPSALGLDVDRFEADRRSRGGRPRASPATSREALRAGVAGDADARATRMRLDWTTVRLSRTSISKRDASPRRPMSGPRGRRHI